jgi:hypothetical protein
MRKLFAVLAVTALVACTGDDLVQVTGGDVTGTYNLTTINGAALPFLLQESGPKVEVFSDSYVLQSAGKFTQSTSFRVTSGDTVSFETFPDSGVYAVQGSTIQLTFLSDSSIIVGTLAGGQLAFGAGGLTTVYVKQ